MIPALDAERTVGAVVAGLGEASRAQGVSLPVLVVDDGSRDGTRAAALTAGARVISHPENRGKGAALRTGLAAALATGADAMVTLDADGQHPPEEALRLALHPAPLDALLVAVRDLRAAGAPRANQRSNAFSNAFLSLVTGRRLSDTQCGLRRYPTRGLLALGCRADGFDFEAEALLRAALLGRPALLEVPARVLYPEDRTSHFHAVRDPARIVRRVLTVLATTPRRRP